MCVHGWCNKAILALEIAETILEVKKRATQHSNSKTRFKSRLVSSPGRRVSNHHTYHRNYQHGTLGGGGQ
jgi:hypothetical protein